jgi:hypothetical protein
VQVRLRVQNALDLTVADGDQNVIVRSSHGVFTAQPKDGVYFATLPADPSPGSVFTIDIANPRYHPFAASFDVVNTPLGLPAYKLRVGGGISHAVSLEPSGVDAIAILSKLLQVDGKPDPLKIANPQDGNWFHTQLTDEGSFFRGNEKPLLKLKDPVVGPEKTQGIERLVFDIQSPVRPQGRIYAFEYKTVTAPKLIMVWHPADMDFSKPKPAGSEFRVPYHFYFHPTAHDPTPYPFGKNAKGDQPHVGLAYRHTMFESWGSVQHYYSRKRLVYVVPVGNLRDQFGEAGSVVGIYALLREINLALHQINGADLGAYQAQPVGRVAISGFSAGVYYMINALLDRSSATGQAFLQNHVGEIYNWDGAIGGKGIKNTVPQDFGKLIKQWWRHKDQYVRVYTSNAQYDTELAFMAKDARPVVKGAAGSFSKSFVQDGTDFGTLVYLPDGFFRQKYKPHEDPMRVYKGIDKDPTDPGFPSYIDTHHWFFTVVMYHALSKSAFPKV